MGSRVWKTMDRFPTAACLFILTVALMIKSFAESFQQLTSAFSALDRHLNLVEERLARVGNVSKAECSHATVVEVGRMYLDCLRTIPGAVISNGADTEQQSTDHMILASRHAVLTGMCQAWLDQGAIPDLFDIKWLHQLVGAIGEADRAIRPQWEAYAAWGRSALRGFVADQYDCLLDSIGGLTEEGLNRPGVVGDWSARDMLAHVLAWEEYGWAILSQWPEPKAGTLTRWEVGESEEELNALLLDRYTERDLIDVLGDLYTYRRRTLRFIDDCDDTRFDSVGSYGLGETGSLTLFLLSMACHCTEHALQILDARAAGRAES